ncbi:hypothetical protein PoB_003484600 [Plakobranchus ocellatus]|uniref:Uncharacterized protein n=1 Tax=Plakobranchus ocellatus TaxID=259542 RepID=A0AAV4AP34_9GAST|nr:hypothetical protein PoB_003484600 [Plakobranchus ocellatus]
MAVRFSKTNRWKCGGGGTRSFKPDLATNITQGQTTLAAQHRAALGVADYRSKKAVFKEDGGMVFKAGGCICLGHLLADWRKTQPFEFEGHGSILVRATGIVGSNRILYQ